MEIAAVKWPSNLKNSLPRDKYTKYSVFQREFYSWYSEERLPGLVEARKDVKPPRITCDLRSRTFGRAAAGFYRAEEKVH